MPAADREPDRTITPETLARMADELLGASLKEKERKAIAELLQSLYGDMAALRAVAVGEEEPATVYDAAEGEA
jgi:hypothetical protein